MSASVLPDLFGAAQNPLTHDRRPKGPPVISLAGGSYGRLTVMGAAGYLGAPPQAAWRCACICGQLIVVRGSDIKRGRTTSCGCWKREHELLGQRYGKLVVVGKRLVGGSWTCKCDCGLDITKTAQQLKSSKHQSCGKCIPRSVPSVPLGDIYGRLTVIGYGGQLYGQTAWKCSCSCGTVCLKAPFDVKSGKVTSCGHACAGKRDAEPEVNLIGQVFGRWTVIEFSQYGKHGPDWRCICACGRTATVRGDGLICGTSLSCGCLRKDRGRGRRVKRPSQVGSI